MIWHAIAEGRATWAEAMSEPLEHFLDIDEMLAVRRDTNDLHVTNPDAVSQGRSSVGMTQAQLEQLAASLGA